MTATARKRFHDVVGQHSEVEREPIDIEALVIEGHW